MTEQKLYEIVRWYSSGRTRRCILQKGLTLKEARAHCKDSSTKKTDIYFDGFRRSSKK